MREQLGGKLRRGVEHVLAVVEDEQQRQWLQ
jgi:hypothetical protein